MVRMGRAGLGWGLVVAALALSGCGSVSAAAGAGGASEPTATSPVERPVGGSGLAPAGGGRAMSGTLGGSLAPAFPLTLRRTGGIAAYDDTVVLKANGQILVETRTIRGRSCTLASSPQRRLLVALSTLRLDEAPATTSDPTPSDSSGASDETSEPIHISVTDREARLVDLSDPSLGEVASMVGALIADVTLTSPATTSCRTPAVAPPTETP